jgi:hypothetical protein
MSAENTPEQQRESLTPVPGNITGINVLSRDFSREKGTTGSLDWNNVRNVRIQTILVCIVQAQNQGERWIQRIQTPVAGKNAI